MSGPRSRPFTRHQARAYVYALVLRGNRAKPLSSFPGAASGCAAPRSRGRPPSPPLFRSPRVLSKPLLPGRFFALTGKGLTGAHGSSRPSSRGPGEVLRPASASPSLSRRRKSGSRPWELRLHRMNLITSIRAKGS